MTTWERGEKTIFLVALVFIATVLTGCFPYRFTDAPAVSGRVVNARSRRAIIGATIAFEGVPERTPTTQTAVDGSFSLPAVKRWATYIVGMESPHQGELHVEAKGYQSAHIPLRWRDQPVKLNAPVALNIAP